MKTCVTLDLDLGSSWLPGPGVRGLDLTREKTACAVSLAVSFWAVPLVAMGWLWLRLRVSKSCFWFTQQLSSELIRACAFEWESVTWLHCRKAMGPGVLGCFLGGSTQAPYLQGLLFPHL